MTRFILPLCCLLTALNLSAQSVVHPKVDETLDTPELTLRFQERKQNYSPNGVSREKDLYSPKSVNIHPSGEKYYVNSLEGGNTLVFDFATGEKLKVILHTFDETKDKGLWAPESGLFSFNHHYAHPNSFTGKPVESVFTHGGRYLWVPYYRRNYDLNAQEPSAMAVIDTDRDQIVRLFETGPLPKMVAVSPDGHYLAVTHWGNNTVGVLDISSPRMEDWHYVACHVVDYQLKLNFSLTTPVDRDNSSGYCLRGTVFTPDNRYLLVGCMGGGGGIAVIDLEQGRYLGRVMGAMPNLRHILLSGGYLYASINKSGHVQRIPLEQFFAAVDQLDGGKSTLATAKGWTSCKVPAGARTIVLSPDGRFVFAACNYASRIAVVDTRDMRFVGELAADSFPVGLDISQDGRFLISTSQGRSGTGGNAVDIFEVTYK